MRDIRRIVCKAIAHHYEYTTGVDGAVNALCQSLLFRAYFYFCIQYGFGDFACDWRFQTSALLPYDLQCD